MENVCALIYAVSTDENRPDFSTNNYLGGFVENKLKANETYVEIDACILLNK